MLCHMEEAKTPKRGQPQKQPLVLGRALLKPAGHGLCRVEVSDQTVIETVFPESSAISVAYVK